MRQFILITLFSFIILPTLFGQMSQLEKEEINYEKGKGFYIEKARKILTDNLAKENWEEVLQAKDYIKNLEDDDFFGLFAGEYWLISFWTEDYNTILKDARTFTADNMEQYSIKLEPQRDRLQNTLMSKTLREKNRLITNIKKTTYTEEEKTFLLLLLKNLTSDISVNPFLQDDINHEAIAFMAKYPDSEFAPFIKQYIHYKLKASKLGIGFELFSGIGYYTQDLFDKYNNMVPLGVTFSATYDNYNIYFRQYFGFTTTNSTINDETGVILDYPIGSKMSNYITDMAFGYAVLDHSSLKAVPFASIGGMGFKVPSAEIEQDPRLEVANMDYQLALGVGLSLDFKIGVNRIPEFQTTSSYGFIRIRYNYYMPFYNNLDGGLHCITVGFGGIGHRLDRDY